MKKTSRVILVILVTLVALGVGACHTTRPSASKCASDNGCGGCETQKSAPKKVSYR